MIFLLAYLYVHHLLFVYGMHKHIKLMNTFGNWLIVAPSRRSTV